MLTDADVRPERKGKMPMWRLAEYIESVGLVEFTRVAIRSTRCHVQERPGRNLHAAEFRIAIRHTRLNQHRTFPAQCLFDGRRHECSVLANRIELIGVVQ